MTTINGNKRKAIELMQQIPFDDAAEFDVFISKADFKFNCAHFIAYKGFRERLHGHNYQISVKVTGNPGGSLAEDGYLIDFGDIKGAARDICKSLNEYFICPMKADCMEIIDTGDQLCLNCEDGSKFVFPKSDCAMLPIYHSSAEEIAHYIYYRMLLKLGVEKFIERGIKLMEVTVAEAPMQQAAFRCPIPRDSAGVEALGKTRIRSRPVPCLSTSGSSDEVGK